MVRTSGGDRRGGEERRDEGPRLSDRALRERDVLLHADQPMTVLGAEEERGLDPRARRRLARGGRGHGRRFHRHIRRRGRGRAEDPAERRHHQPAEDAGGRHDGDTDQDAPQHHGAVRSNCARNLTMASRSASATLVW